MTPPTAQSPATAAASPTEARLPAVTAAIRDAVVCVDGSGAITMWAGGAEALLGWRADDVIGLPATSLVAERHRFALEQALAEWSEGGELDPAHRGSLELDVLRRDGTELPVELTLNAGDHDGDAFLVAVVRDITERRRAAQELERSNVELAQFASVASHDLAEPLRIVKGYLKLLAARYAGRLDEHADQILEHVTGSAEQMEDLIEALLRLARAGAGRPDIQPVDARRAALEAATGLAVPARGRGVTVDVGELPQIDADPTLLRQIFQNLLSNAIKFAGGDDRAPRVRITAEWEPGEWTFVVADNGPGIPAGDRTRIFEMLSRGSTQPDCGRGVGIGLALCKRAVERHGGRIWVTDAPGGGAQLRFTIPDDAGTR